MPRVQMTCPRCRQPIMAEIEQLFDVGADPEAKQRFLSGNFNTANCPNCGYQGPLSTPVVYHDPERELLLTYFPAELGLPVNEQERLIGPLITQVTNRLPAEKRKAYLLRPQTMFTQQAMIERVLEGEGITKEMMDASQKRLNLLQRLLTASSADVRKEIIQQENAIMDEQFFQIIGRLIQASMAQGDENSARALDALQRELLPMTEVGRRMQDQNAEMQAAVESLQQASQQGLTREKLIDLFMAAPSDVRVATIASLVRQGLDYEFFQILTGRIEAAQGEEQQKLTALREQLLQLTKEIDQRMQEQAQASRALLKEILQAENVQEAAEQAMPNMDDYFAEALRTELEEARKAGNTERIGKIQQVVEIIQQASAPPPEIALAEELLRAENEQELDQLLEEHAAEITPEFLDVVRSLIAQLQEQNQQPELLKQLQDTYRAALRFSMRANLGK